MKINKIKGVLGLGAVTLSLIGFVNAQSLSRQLQFGMSGADVSVLQTFLARDASIYPEGKITGYFGDLTRTAVMRFQAARGLSQVGRVGPQTLALINQLLSNMGGTTVPGVDTTSATIMNATASTYNTGATINFTTSENAQSKVYYSTDWLQMYETDNDVIFNNGSVAMTDTSFRTSHSVTLNNLQSNTNYYYVIYTKDASGNVSIKYTSSFRTQ